VLADLRAAAFPLCTAQATEPLEIAVLRSLVQRMSTLPGQRSIVFVSPGFRVDNVAMPSLDRLVDSAVASKVSIHVLEVGRLSGGAGAPRSGGQLWGTESQNVIRPDGTSGEIYQPTPTYAPEPASRPWSGDQVTGVLRQIAHGTGGDFVEGGNRIEAAFRRLAPPENYYLLGFVPANLKTDDSFHPLKVTLHEKGKLTVQTRSGYYAWARPHPNGTP